MRYDDLEYASCVVDGVEKKLLLDLYVPEKRTEGRHPLLVYIHGGGWMGGSKENCPNEIIVQHDYAVASIDYRLSHEGTFPAQIHDVKGAVRWLRAQADAYELDPQRFGAWGESAGGHLSALLGTSAKVPVLEGPHGNQHVSSAVQAVCDCCGPTDLTHVPPAFTEIPAAFLAPDAPHHPPPGIYGAWFEYTLATHKLVGGPVADRMELAKLANPITHVNPDNPPFLITHGELDELLANALREQGVEVTFVRFPELGHAHANNPKVMEAALAFFDAHLK